MKIKKALALVGILSLIFGAFQNCGKMHSAGSDEGAMSASSSSDPAVHVVVPNAPTLSIYQNASQVADNLALGVNVAYQLRVDSDTTPSAVDWNVYSGINGFANCALTGTDVGDRAFSCTSVGIGHADVKVHYADGSVVATKFERLVNSTASTLPPGSTVNFNILAGTSTQAWNTAAAPVVVFKGQTLHIVNKDSTFHRLHTNGVPCPHEPSNITTDQSYDCVIGAAHDPGAGDLYDHNFGTAAKFYVAAYDGAALYTTQKFNIAGAQKACVDCHGALATSAVKNATLVKIKANIAANSGGMGAINLTDDQLSAIVYELGK
jgi:hypothetical protein